MAQKLDFDYSEVNNYNDFIISFNINALPMLFTVI